MSSYNIAAAQPWHGWLRAIAAAALLSTLGSAATAAAPSITGTPPATVVAAHPFAFQPTVGNPGGKALHFSIVNKPSWAQFDTRTGRLAGTPLPQANVGTFANILIGVSDGGPFELLAPFTITVLPSSSIGSAAPPPGGTGSATLSWTPPTRNTDGSVLTDLAGYRIYYGRTPDLGSAVTLTNMGLTRYVMSGLLQATWYFAMTAFDRTGVESARTEVASIAITQ